MSAEFIAIVAVGISLAGLFLRLHLVMNRRIDRLEDRLTTHQQQTVARFEALERGMADLRERMARLEGLLDGLRDSIGRAVA